MKLRTPLVSNQKVQVNRDMDIRGGKEETYQSLYHLAEIHLAEHTKPKMGKALFPYHALTIQSNHSQELAYGPGGTGVCRNLMPKGCCPTSNHAHTFTPANGGQHATEEAKEISHQVVGRVKAKARARIKVRKGKSKGKGKGKDKGISTKSKGKGKKGKEWRHSSTPRPGFKLLPITEYAS